MEPREGEAWGPTTNRAHAFPRSERPGYARRRRRKQRRAHARAHRYLGALLRGRV